MALLCGQDLIAHARLGVLQPRRVKLSEVALGLFLSGGASAKNLPLLREHGIAAIVNVGGGKCHFANAIVYNKIGLLDKSDANILPHLHNACDFIHNQLQSSANVLVHCMGGFSRSPTVVVAYLVKYRQLSVDDALTVCRLAHPRANPRPNFIAQLHDFQTQCASQA
ncbi:unnamed protein product [Aphanomyces euteiches]|uniref:Protein-serine/threonine phosphatase n=1 Tax=Aphanomyces euteiches TaxID=100861 RepID=A0A6G0XV39_9STRA|nr:hypothetical protein Ae201684_000887 [Aphanomyces euteiches]KAH9099760.1 hypothetical protein Ae201684P_018770 [Aphanomyces euteiches]KAH9140639.1 hypothetical protein AeRB84_015139 [Aphanomyces euteiches]KAH9148756.1 hypothetical protein AeRB84_008006 [Aphanomyces euteiches]KAH9150709.1 hypothetical protein AeRB84_006495 [Aphanomyces euteiches]